jgi:glycosyltransferase involved in cell wall biosynthesis
VEVYTRRDDSGLPERVRMPGGIDVIHVPAGPPEPIAKDELLPFIPDFGRWLADRWACAGRAGRVPDVVHAHFWMSGLAATAAAGHVAGAAVARIPVLQTFHALGAVKRRMQGADDASPPGRIAAETWLAQTVDGVIATCSDEVRELAAMGTQPRRVEIVPCGVDLEHFRPFGPPSLPPGLPVLRAGEHRLLCVGRLVERKGVDTVVSMLAELPSCHLVVAGGPPVDRVEADAVAVRLRDVAEAHGVADRLHLLGNVVRADIPSLLRWADLVVATPWYEPFGMVPLEAMACARPVVASAVGGMLDTVVPGRTGVLVPPRDPAALAIAVRELLADPDGLDAMAREGRRRAVADYGWDTIARDVEAAYCAALPAGHRSLMRSLIGTEAI